MIDIKITSPEGGNMTGYVLNLQLFAEFFLRQLDKAAQGGEFVRFKSIDAMRIVIQFIDPDAKVLSEMAIEPPVNVFGQIHGLFVQVLQREAYASLFVWASGDEADCTLAMLESFSRLDDAEIEQLLPPVASDGSVN
jgi:hypothetical protein